jgi:hypothetical protein
LTRHRFAVFILVTLSLASNFWFLLDVAGAYARRLDSSGLGVPAFERRFEVLRKALPPRSVLGYVSDNPNDTQAQAEFYLTQYALVPSFVKFSTEEHFVVANFHTNSPNRAMLQAKHLVLVQDFGNDIFIYQNINR